MIYYSIPWSSTGNLGQAYNDFMKMLPTDADFACFIDGDASFLTNNFGKQLDDIVAKYPHCGLFTATTNRVKNSVQVTGDWVSNDMAHHRELAKRKQEEQYDEIQDISDVSNNLLSGVVILIRKSTWRKIGGFKEGLLGVDNDLHLKAYQYFEPTYLMKGVYVYHWCRGGSKTDVSHLTATQERKESNRIIQEKRNNVLRKGSKKIIYSAITGEYEAPLVHNIPPGWEYRLYSNREGVGTHYVENNGLTDVKLARHIKICPWEYFDFDVCIWIDGNTIFDPNAIDMLSGYEFVISTHPERDCIYAEAEAILKFGKDKPETINPIIEQYIEEGYPKKNGLVASHAIVRKNTEGNKIFCEKWWEQVKERSHRDQMSFNYVLWKYGMPMLTFIPFKTVFKTVSTHRSIKSRYAHSNRRRR